MLYGMAEPIHEALRRLGSGPRLHAGRRARARHGVPRAAAAGEHVERVLPAPPASRGNSQSRSCCRSPAPSRIVRRAAPPADATEPGRSSTSRAVEPRPLPTRRERAPMEVVAGGRAAPRRRPRVIDGEQSTQGDDRLGRPDPSPSRDRRRRRRDAEVDAAVAAAAGVAALAGDTAAPSGPSCSGRPSGCGAARRAGGAGGLRGGQAVARGRRRRRRGDRLLRVLRPRCCGSPAARRVVRPARTTATSTSRAASRSSAPWNFPLAILTGMTTAALVTGNTVILKPAEQSPDHRRKLMEVFDGGRPAAGRGALPPRASARRSARRWSSTPTSR